MPSPRGAGVASTARVLVVLLVVVVAAMIGREVYRWWLFQEEREELVRMRERLVETGVAVVRAETRLDTLRHAVDRMDRVLERDRRALDVYARSAREGTLPPHLYAAYREDLKHYNQKLERRNARYREWEEERARGRAALDHYHALADSIRTLAREVGEPYYPVPSPVEAAVERGVLRESP